MDVQPSDLPKAVRRLPSGAEWVDISDEFVNWLCSANAGWLNRGNLLGFAEGVRNMPPGTNIVEIGSYLGLSTNLISYYKRKFNRTERTVTCDCWSPYVPNGALPIPRRFGPFTKQTYVRNIMMFSSENLPWTIEARSDEFFASWKAATTTKDVLGRDLTLGGPIGFCYIDALHSYEASQADFRNCDQHLVPGGYVLFDDSSDDSNWGVKKTVAEIMQMPNYELVCKNPNYFFRKKAA
jgi:hypothetical protein